jgi:uncharacterized protein YebE (UPF0316 family)
MEFFGFSSEFLFTWVLLPALIFTARVCDVSLGTIRIIFLSKGIKYLAPLIGFFEVIIWLLAITQILQHLTNVYYYLFFAGGFATGNFVGICLEEKLSIGIVYIRIITRKDPSQLIDALKKANYNITTIDAEGPKGEVKIIFTVVKKQLLNNVLALVKKYNPHAFYSVEDIRYVSEDIPSSSPPFFRRGYHYFLRLVRKGK